MLFNAKPLGVYPAVEGRQASAAKPGPLPEAFQKEGEPTYDYIVVGSGSAGSSLVGELAQRDPGASVLLLEAGPSNDTPLIHDFTKAMQLRGTVYDWNDKSLPQAGLLGRKMPYDAGHALGGSSSINGMVWVRGAREDYDGWAKAGCGGWDYDSLLPVFRRQETFEGGSSIYRGGSGPLFVSNSISQNPVSMDFVKAMQASGIAFNPDYNAASQWGVVYSQLNARPEPSPTHGYRQDAFSVYRGALGQGNVDVVFGALVERIHFDAQRRAESLALTYGGAPLKVHAAREIILCAGALRSPQLLMVSGVGPAAELSRLGIPLVADVPGVGQNLQDQVIVFVVHPLARVDTGHYSPMSNNVFLNGLPGTPQIGAPRFEVQSFYMQANPGFPPNQYALGAIVLHPESRGSIRLASAHMNQPPLIQPNLLSTPADRLAALEGLRLVRELANQFEARSTWLKAETNPGPSVTSDKDLLQYIEESAVPDFHYVGTCRMGPGSDPSAVVDPQLRVRGVSGLRVADASIMPSVTSGNTNAPSMMIGSRCADWILDPALQIEEETRCP